MSRNACMTGHDVRVTAADRLPVAVREMHMADERAARAQRRREVRLLEVHVKQIAEQLHVFGAERFQKRHRVGGAVEEVGLVTVQRLVEQRHAERVGARTELFERLRKPRERRRAFDARLHAALHRADDGRRVEATREIQDGRDEIHRAPADHRVGIGQAQLVFHPACAGADGGDFERVLGEKFLQGPRVERVRGGRKNFHGIEAERRRPGAAGGEVIPENKRPAARLRHK